MTLALSPLRSLTHIAASCLTFSAFAALPSAYAQSYTIGGEARTFAMAEPGWLFPRTGNVQPL